MKKYIIQGIKNRLEAKKTEWADNYIASEYQKTLVTPDAKKQISSAELNMQIISSTIEFLKTLLKKETNK